MKWVYQILVLMHFRCLLNYIICIFFHSLYLKQDKKNCWRKGNQTQTVIFEFTRKWKKSETSKYGVNPKYWTIFVRNYIVSKANEWNGKIRKELKWKHDKIERFESEISSDYTSELTLSNFPCENVRCPNFHSEYNQMNSLNRFLSLHQIKITANNNNKLVTHQKIIQRHNRREPKTITIIMIVILIENI